MKKESYKSVELMERIGISKVQLAHWINSGAIRPFIDDNRRGGVRYFNRQNLVEGFICKALNRHRIPVKNISMILENTRSQKGFQRLIDGDEIENKEDFFVIAVPITGFDDFEDRMTSFDVNPKVPIEAVLKMDLPAGQLEMYQVITHTYIILPLSELCEILPDLSTGIVVNLSRIAREALGG